jgi:YidC/Oxa1 family membrane protein insertase
MDLYAREGYSPMAGCGPLLIQMPVLIILYNVIINPLKYICGWSADQIKVISETLNLADKIKEFSSRDIGLIQYLHESSNELMVNNALVAANLETVDFAAIPDFKMGIFDLSMNPTFASILIIVPILTFIFQLISAKITRKFTFQPMQDDKATNSTMKVMDILLPGMMTAIAFGVPAAIGIYWMFNNILGAIQTICVNKAMPIPAFTAEDVKNAEKELSGKAYKAKYAPVENVKPTKSLHYIDFDDEEEIADLGEYESIYDKTPEEREKASEVKEVVPEKQQKLFGKADMKDDK